MVKDGGEDRAAMYVNMKTGGPRQCKKMKGEVVSGRSLNGG